MKSKALSFGIRSTDRNSHSIRRLVSTVLLLAPIATFADTNTLPGAACQPEKETSRVFRPGDEAGAATWNPSSSEQIYSCPILQSFEMLTETGSGSAISKCK